MADTNNEENKDTKEGAEDKPSLFTQEQVDSIMAGNKRDLRDQLKVYEEKVNTLEASLSEQQAFKKMMEDAAREAGVGFGEDGLSELDDDDSEFEEFLNSATPPKGVNPELWKTFQLMKHGHSRELQELQSARVDDSKTLKSIQESLEQERAARAAVETQARATQGDNMLLEAVNQKGLDPVDVEAAYRYFLPQRVYVEGRGWMYKPRGVDHVDDYISLEAGVRKEFPPYLQKSSTSRGGSGSTGGESIEALNSQIGQKRQDLEAAHSQAQRSGGAPRAIAAFQRIQRELAALEETAANL